MILMISYILDFFVHWVKSYYKTKFKKQRLHVEVNPNACLVESRVLEGRIEIVTGPNPSGTGVIANTTLIASSWQTSPMTRNPWRLLGSCKSS
jgi:hypothetical protein